MDYRSRGSRGFTLIELLVVISIIALLIGILLPALGAARSSARSIQCLANQRQIAVARNAYAVDYNDGMYIAANPFTGGGPQSTTYTVGGVSVVIYSADRGLPFVAEPGGTFLWQYGGPSGHGILFEEDYISDLEFFFCPDPPVATVANWGITGEPRQVESNDENFGAQNWGTLGVNFQKRVGVGTFANRSEVVSRDDRTRIAAANNVSESEVYLGTLRFSDNANLSLSWCQHWYNDVKGAHGDKGLNAVYGDGSGTFIPFGGVYDRSNMRFISQLYSWLDTRGDTLDKYDLGG